MLFDQLSGPSLRLKMWMCWPALVLARIVIFSVGCCLGKFWEKYLYFLPKEVEGHRQRRKVATEVTVRTGPLHKDEGGCGAKELFGEQEGEGDIVVYLTKTGTDVHLLRCPGLNSADFSKMKKTSICKHCMKIRRLTLLKAD